MSPKINVNGNEYNGFDELPEELKKKLQEKLKNNPKAESLLKEFGVNPDKPEYSSTSEIFSDTANGSSGDMKNSFSPNVSFGSSTDPFSKDPFAKDKGNGTGMMIGIVVLVCILGVVGLIFGINMVTQSWEETYALRGDPSHFDPFASVNEVRSHFDVNAKLSSIDIQYVRSDGTMDLTAKNYKPTTTYKFYRELAQPPKNAPPVGAGATASGKWYEPVEADVYEPGQWRYVSKMGGGVSTEYNYSNKGIDLNRDDPTATPDTFIDDPKCSLKDFWKTAETKGAQADAVASVNYDSSGYDFSISNTDVSLQFDKDCKLKTD